MARRKKLKKSKNLNADQILQILVARYVRLMNFNLPEKREVPNIIQPVFTSLKEYGKQAKKVNEVNAFNAGIQIKKEKQKDLMRKIEKQIFSFLPKYHWFVVKVGKDDHYAVGVSTSDWGGGQSYIHMKEFTPGEPNKLHELKHSAI